MLPKIIKYKNLIITSCFILIIYFISRKIDQQIIITTVTQTGPFAPLTYIIFTLFTYVVAPISGTPSMMIGFLLFGKQVVVYHTIATIMSFITNFWIGRIYGKEIVAHLVGTKAMHQIDRFVDNYSYKALFLFRTFAGGFHDFISYAYGLTEVKFTKYFIISLVPAVTYSFIWYFVILHEVQTLTEFSLKTIGLMGPIWLISPLVILIFAKEKK